MINSSYCLLDDPLLDESRLSSCDDSNVDVDFEMSGHTFTYLGLGYLNMNMSYATEFGVMKVFRVKDDLGTTQYIGWRHKHTSLDAQAKRLLSEFYSDREKRILDSSWIYKDFATGYMNITPLTSAYRNLSFTQSHGSYPVHIVEPELGHADVLWWSADYNGHETRIGGMPTYGSQEPSHYTEYEPYGRVIMERNGERYTMPFLAQYVTGNGKYIHVYATRPKGSKELLTCAIVDGTIPDNVTVDENDFTWDCVHTFAYKPLANRWPTQPVENIWPTFAYPPLGIDAEEYGHIVMTIGKNKQFDADINNLLLDNVLYVAYNGEENAVVYYS